MPFVKVNTNAVIGNEQTSPLLRALSQLVAKETGKPERYVMVQLSASNSMLFAGNDAPLAYVECKSIGLTSQQAKQLSASLCQLLATGLALPAERIYIEFSNCPAEFWGWNGATFG